MKDLELKDLTPFTVFLGANGSGKSTVFDVMAFLSECFTSGLRRAWEKRNRFKELRTRGSNGPIIIELKYREMEKTPLITYHLAIDEGAGGPFVAEEILQWRRGRRGKPFRILDFKKGRGSVVTGEMPDIEDERVDETLDSPETLAVSTLGQLARNPRVMALRRFITSWHLSYLSADSTRGKPEAGAQEHLSSTGDNLPNVIQYLREQHPERLDIIMQALRRRVPRLEKVDARILDDGRLLLEIKDAPFDKPVLSKYTSDGTLKMLSYMTLLNDPDPPQLIGIEEPENYLYPTLLDSLAEEFRTASQRSQILVTTHSPYFVNNLHPEEVWILYRGEDGYTKAKRASDMRGIPEFMEAGGKLGQLWMEHHFDVGYPIAGLLRQDEADPKRACN